MSCIRAVARTDPLALFDAAAGLYSERFFWSSGDGALTVAAVGAIWTCSATGPARFRAVNRAWDQLRERLHVEGREPAIGAGPIAVGGFAFDASSMRSEAWQPFGDACLILPRILLTSSTSETWLTTNRLANEASARDEVLLDSVIGTCFRPKAGTVAFAPAGEIGPAAEWKGCIESVLRRLRHGQAGTGLQKVVLARQVVLKGTHAANPANVVDNLRETYANCSHFAVAKGSRCFVGASPERLVRLRDSAAHVACLAGTTGRGATNEEDDRLARELLDSAKERLEHDLVARALRQDLEEAGVRLGIFDAPTVERLPNVQHLLTKFQGRSPDATSVVDLVARLHPTPAVGGYPREDALRVIRETEAFDRGWYAGPVGWTDRNGNGEFTVGIRSALMNGTEARLFAGCGIVSDSDPERELAESQLKLKPMLSALAAVG
ncbi:MAG: isochorismate synthase [Chloroflexota bacterium]